MGFFSDLRDDLSQAVSELMPAEETKKQTAAEAKAEGYTREETWKIRESPEQDGGYDADLSRMLDQMDEIAVSGEMGEAAPETAVANTVTAAGEEVQEEENSEKTARLPHIETAVVTGNTVIRGDIVSKEDLEVKGGIVGNVEAMGKLTISGAIKGNSSAAEICAEGARIDGELKSDGWIRIGQNSVAIGNIFAGSAVIAGAVKGDIDVKESLTLDSSAVVMGNIKSKALRINSGAVFEGVCSQCYSEVNPSSFFEELEKEK